MTHTTVDGDAPRSHAFTVTFGAMDVCTWDEAQAHAEDIKNRLVGAGVEYFNIEVTAL